MILYHALPKEYAEAQLDNNGFTNRHPIFKKHKDTTPGIWATENPQWSLEASYNNGNYEVWEDGTIIAWNDNHRDFLDVGWFIGVKETV